MTVDEIASVLRRLGCPPQKSLLMARQLDRKARMDADRQKISYHVALEHLISLMAQGWAAQGHSESPIKD